MSKLSSFFRTLFLSSSNPGYYKDVLAAKPGFSWKYWAFFNLVIALVFTVVASIPVSMFNVQEAVDQVVSVYPNELEVTLDKSGLAINQPLPYQIPVPRNSDSNFDSMRIRNFVTFADDADIQGLQDVYSYESFVVLTQSTVYAYKDVDSKEIRAYPISLETDERFQLDANLIQNGKNKLMAMPFIKHRWYTVAFGLFILPFVVIGLFLVRFVTLVLYTALLWVAVKLTLPRAQKLSYSTLFRVGMHSITPVILAAMVLNIVQQDWFGGVWYFLAYLIWTMICLNAALPDTAAAAATVRASTKKAASKSMKPAKKVSAKRK